ncbi:hypothetical protein TWF281_011245 [Arthrobotrys megalospora]
MTMEKCLLQIAGENYKYAGIEYGSECYYGVSLPTNAQQATSGCDMSCSGKAGEACGGGYRLTLYQNTEYLPPPTFNPGVGDYHLLGCYSDNVNARGLQHNWNNYQYMTVEGCIRRAAAQGFRYAAVEYYGECYMGNVLASTSTVISNTVCNARCNGLRSEICGGADSMAVYENTAYVVNTGDFEYDGCYTDDANNRALDHYAVNWDHMTNELCAQYAAGFKYFGTEYYGECFWGNALEGSTPAASGCNTPCAGDNAQMCGGGNRLSLYINSEYEEPAPPTINEGYYPWVLEGCHDDSPSNRALSNVHISDTMTIDDCFNLAISYKYAAAQEGYACYWGDELGTSSQSTDLAYCDVGCAGKPSEVCGGVGRNILYENTEYDPAGDIQDIIDALAALVAAWLDLKAKIAEVVAIIALPPEEPAKLKERDETSPLLPGKVQAMKGSAKNTRNTLQKVKTALRKKSPRAKRHIDTSQRAVQNDQTIEDAISIAESSKALLQVEEATVGSISVIATGGSTGVGGAAGAVSTFLQGLFGIGALATIPTIALLAHMRRWQPEAGEGGGGEEQEPEEEEDECDQEGEERVLIIMFKDGTTDAQYESIVSALPRNPSNLRIDYPKVDWRLYRTVISPCWDEKLTLLWEDINSPIRFIIHDEETQWDELEESTDFMRRNAAEDKARLKKRDFEIAVGNLDPGWNIYAQTDAPRHLAWLSSPHKNIGYHGRYYLVEGGNSYTFLGDQQGAGSVVYIIDQDFLENHNDYGGNVLSYIPAQSKWTGARADRTHGTCCASLATGGYCGVAKQAQLVLCSTEHMRRDLGVPPTDKTQSAYIFYTLIGEILTHAAQWERKAVITMSVSLASKPFNTPGSNTFQINGGGDWWSATFDKLDDKGIVMVVSAGNKHPQQVDTRYPRKAGGPNTSLIVVGNAWTDDGRFKNSQFDPHSKGIVSIYAVGVRVWCASETAIDAYRLGSGTSTGTPQVAGIVAAMLSFQLMQPNIMVHLTSSAKWGYAVKQALIQFSLNNKGNAFSNDPDTGDVPRASWGVVVPCAGVADAADIPADPSMVDPMRATTSRITTILPNPVQGGLMASGGTVHLPNTPICIAMPTP